VALFDSTFQLTMDDFRARFNRSGPSLVGLYCNLMTKQNVLRMLPLCQASGGV
jgi:hypothetical protein